MMMQRNYSDTHTPETPEPLSKTDHLCKLIQLPRHTTEADAHPDVGDLLLEIKLESESILRLMEQHQSQLSTDR